MSDMFLSQLSVDVRNLKSKVDRLSTVEKTRITNRTPANGHDTGNIGDICWDASYIYICTSANYWARAAITHW